MTLSNMAMRSPGGSSVPSAESVHPDAGWAFQSRMVGRRVLPILILASLAPACGLGPSSAPDPYAITPYIGTTLSGPAPTFRLVDQTGAVFALSDFQGRIVALTFFDSQCKSVCPITAAQLRTTHQELGDLSASVVFLGVSVNLQAAKVADVAAATQEWRLDGIEGLHFFTGGPDELPAVWKAYHVAVYRPPEEAGELWHTPGVFLIDRKGNLRWYVSTPFDEEGVARWTSPLSDLLGLHIRELLAEGSG